MAMRCSWGTEWKEAMVVMVRHMLQADYDYIKVFNKVRKFINKYKDLELFQRHGEHGGAWYWFAQLKKALGPQGVKRTREGLAIP